MVDREKEFEALRDLVHRDDVRLITFTGPGGTGIHRAIQMQTGNLRFLTLTNGQEGNWGGRNQTALWGFSFGDFH